MMEIYQGKFGFSDGELGSVPEKVFLPVGRKVRKLKIKRNVRTKYKKFLMRPNIRYEVSKTNVLLELEEEDERMKNIATIFESTRVDGSRYVTVLAYEDLDLDNAKSIANHLDLLPEK